MIYFILLTIGFVAGYLSGTRTKNGCYFTTVLVDLLTDHFLGCNRSKTCSCCKSTRVMFLPDETQPCKSFYSALMGLNPHGHCAFEDTQRLYRNRYKPRMHCKYNHGRPNEPSSALIELYRTLEAAQESICICIMMIRLKEMVKFLIYLKVKKNIKIKIIINTKCKPEYSSKKEMKLLQGAGVEVKTNNEGMVHNKFVIIDRKTLISGSINWTYVAFNSNDETIMFTSQWAIVDEFSKKFDRMWMEMSPFDSTTMTTPTVQHVEPTSAPVKAGCCFMVKADDRRPSCQSYNESDNESDENQSSGSPWAFKTTRRTYSSSQDDMYIASSEADADSSEEGVSLAVPSLLATPRKYAGAF